MSSLPPSAPRGRSNRPASSRLIESLEQRRLLSWTILEPSSYSEGDEPAFTAFDPLANPADYTFEWSALFNDQPIGGENPTPTQFALDQLPNHGSLQVTLEATETATNTTTTTSITRSVSNVLPTISAVQFFVPPESEVQAKPQFEGQIFHVVVVASDPGPEDQLNLTYRLALQKHNGVSYVTQFFFEGGVGDFQKVIELSIPDEGNWRLFAAVIDDVSGTTSAAHLLPIQNAAPVPTVSGAPGSSDVGTEITLTVDPNDPGASSAALYPSPPYTWAPGVLPSDHDDTHTFDWTITRLDDNAVVATGDTDQISFTPTETGDYEYLVVVNDNDGASGQASGVFTVTDVQAATITYSGLQYFSTSSNTDNTADITLRATLTDLGGDSPAIGNAQVAFKVYHPLNGLVRSSQVGVVSSDGISGTATDTFTYALAADADSLTVVVEVVGGGYTADPIAVPLTVSQTETGRVVGAGWLEMSNSGGLLAGGAGARTHFSFNAQRTSTSVTGAFSMTYQGADGNTYSVSSTEVTSLFTWSDSGLSRAAMTATVDIYQVRRAGGPLLVHSGMNLEVALADGGNGGGFDRVSFSVWNPAGGGLMFANHLDGSESVSEQLLGAGNITIWLN